MSEQRQDDADYHSISGSENVNDDTPLRQDSNGTGLNRGSRSAFTDRTIQNFFVFGLITIVFSLVGFLVMFRDNFFPSPPPQPPTAATPPPRSFDLSPTPTRAPTLSHSPTSSRSPSRSPLSAPPSISIEPSNDPVTTFQPSLSMFPTTSEPSPSPTFGGRARLITDKIISAMKNVISEEDLLAYQNNTSAQSKALHWIIDIDQSNLNSNDIHLLQRFLLAVIYYQMDGPNWAQKDRWLFVASECTWYGVTCVEGNGNVIGINLGHNNLDGELPPEVGAFINLETFWLHGNTIKGSIPKTIGFLGLLKSLGLWDNDLRGEIPTEIGLMSSLESIYLYRNSLNGSVPSEIGRLVMLDDLCLYDNELTGLIPEEVAKPYFLKRIWFTGNNLNGTISPSIMDMPNLEKLYLDRNSMSGYIPTGSAPKLNDMRINNNFFEGCPPILLFKVPNLKILYLDNNELSCRIPSFALLSEGILEDLQMYANRFFGALPEVFGEPALRVLDLHDNSFTGSIPSSFSNMKNLAKLDLSINDLSGTLPSDLAPLEQIEYLELHNNTFQGNIPSSWKSMLKAKEMTFDSNDLVGSMPYELCELTLNNLQILTADCQEVNPEVICDCCICPPETEALSRNKLYQVSEKEY